MHDMTQARAKAQAQHSCWIKLFKRVVQSRTSKMGFPDSAWPHRYNSDSAFTYSDTKSRSSMGAVFLTIDKKGLTSSPSSNRLRFP